MDLSSFDIQILVISFTLALFIFWKQCISASRFPNLPPGPRPGLFGNILKDKYAWMKYAQIGKEYGNVFTVWAGNTPFIVINNYQDAIDILEKRGSASTADRPDSIIGSVYSGNLRMAFCRYGPTWRKMRKALHTHLQQKTVALYEPRLEGATRNFILDIFKSPENFAGHARRFSATTVINMSYGKQTPTSYNDKDIVEILRILRNIFRNIPPTRWLGDQFPIFRKIPGYLSEPRKVFEYEVNLYTAYLEDVQKKMETNSVEECFSTYILNSLEETGLTFTQAAYLAGSLFGAGSETTASSIIISILAAACSPGSQVWLCEELDKVVGRERPPQFSDMQDLPRLTAWVNEVVRWKPIAPMGLTHALNEDLAWNGYVFPKGAWVAGNVWAIHMDEKLYPNANTFDPKRWVIKGDDGKETIRKNIAPVGFGFGRRICPGKHIATSSLHITIASLLWTFKIQKPIDPETKREVELDTVTSDGSSAAPKPFQVDFKERFSGAVKVFENLESTAL